jgi:MFS family permease
VVAVGSLLSATAGDLGQLLAWRFVAGAGSAMYMTGAAAYLTDIADPGNRARMMGLNQGALLFGTSLGPAVGGLVAEFTNYQAPFVVVGALAGVCAVWAFRALPETHAGAGSARERGSSAGTGANRRSWLRDTRDLATNMPFFLIAWSRWARS